MRVTPLAAAVFLAGLMGCASALNPPGEADISDPGILASIETRLKAKRGLDLRTVTVNVNARVVTISGLSSSYNDRATIIEIARDTRGVDQVIDNLVVSD